MKDFTSAHDLEDFLASSISGYISTNPRGKITSANNKIKEWLNKSNEALIGEHITSILTVGSRIFYETHLSPMLTLKGSFEEVAVELMQDGGGKMQALMNGYAKQDENGLPYVIWLTFYRAKERIVYEDNLRNAILSTENTLKTEREMAILREQFIAVLGHDLRNPLGAIKTGAALLGRSVLSDRDKSIVGTIAKSTQRMEELIANVMDFARVRMGSGIALSKEKVSLDPIMEHIVNELTISFPDRGVITDFNVNEPVNCDPNRMAQMLSNLLANAITHGAANQPILISSKINKEILEVRFSNGGSPISNETLSTLFEPFTREAKTPSQQGLGLGLYIASQIAKAHGGELTATSDLEQTSFTFRMPVMFPSNG
ncbi:PAS domain-containing sensor histidine kinase [Pedobacter jeongneungensis]|uniref:PAS domain-containing sensor histidine kinase n=1 Tax=Pedobacter jeongneungensis TaxID=947309 RepID=UPI000468BCEB|nr:PAS domain-containing sensor histidine kinase [Pedobacter jeongneungensis]